MTPAAICIQHIKGYLLIIHIVIDGSIWVKSPITLWKNYLFIMERYRIIYFLIAVEKILCRCNTT